MKTQIAFACFALFLAQNIVLGLAPQDSRHRNQPAAFMFADVKYYHRFTKADLHEYTPDRQDDLKRWTDMMTINYYRQAKDGETLAAIANGVLENYKANKALVFKTASIPRSKDKPAEHLLVVIFPRADFIEVAFARFKMHNGLGMSAIYSHRIYGKKSGDAMSAWLERNGSTTEMNLMKWDAIPTPPASS